MASKIPYKTPAWRISPEDYLALLQDADEQLKLVRTAYLEEQLSSYTTRVERARTDGGVDLEWAEKSLQDAASRVAERFEPRWYLATKGDRRDTPSGSIAEIAPRLTLPERYTYASVILRGGDHSIDVTLSRSGASITLSGEDQSWLTHSGRWATEVLKTHRPWWWWLVTVRGGLLSALVLGVTYIALSLLLPLTGIPADVAQLIALALEWILVLGVLITSFRFRAVLRMQGPRRAGAFLLQAALLVGGAVLGFLVSRLGDAIFPR